MLPVQSGVACRSVCVILPHDKHKPVLSPSLKSAL